MTQREIVEELGWLGASGYSKLSYIINRRRECSPEDAIKLESITGIDRMIWYEGKKADLKRELKKFQLRWKKQKDLEILEA